MAGDLLYDIQTSLPSEIARVFRQEGLEAIAVIPLRDRGRVIAALNVSSHCHPQVERVTRVALEHLVALGEVAIGRLRASEAQIEAEGKMRVLMEGTNETLKLRVAQRTRELEQAHSTLWAKSRRLELALGASQAGTWEVKAGGEKLIWDARSREIFGYSADELITFDHCLTRIHPEDLSGMLSQFQESFEPGSSDDWDIEFRIMHPVLGIRWMLGLGRVERDEAGRALRMAGINIDITDRKAIERSLFESEQKYRNLHESMMDAFVSVDMAGRIIECNRSYQEMLGYSRDELSRLTYVDITPEKWHDFENRLVAEQIIPLGYSQTYEKEYMCKDGTLLPVELRTFLIRDANGNPSAMWAIVRDITERKQAEKTIREWSETLERQVAARTLEFQQSEARCKQLAEAAFEGILISEEGMILDGNCQLAKMFGYDLTEVIGRALLDFVAPESRPAIAERISSNDESVGEFSVLRKDGSTFPVEVSTRMRREGPRTIRVSALRDLTATKAEAARMQAQRAELEQVQRLALVSEICAGIIHQIGQPLSALGVNLSAAIADLQACQTRTCQSLDILGDIETDVIRMREIVSHLRGLGDAAHAVRMATNLNEVIAGALPLLRPNAEIYQIAVNVDLDGNLPPVKMDAVQMSQVVLNLVRNAMDACADSTAEQRVVRIQTRVLGQDGVEMSVCDRGTGIAEGNLARLFSPFFTTKPDGLGVGLRLCRTIMQAHGGTITGENNAEGGGATFRIFLPREKFHEHSGL